ncbi:MAG: DNA-binding domain-containing protein [Rhodobacteraceae bacterium]|nr:DNA-binding domain-containing protein [Paracoccaceae bacterium]
MPKTPPPEAEAGQAAFAAALLDADAPIPADVAKIRGQAPEKRFAVYRNNVVVSLISALASAYPTVKRLVGAQFFDAMAGVYVREHPPISPMMIFYGAAFPGWVESFPPAETVPYLGGVARLERARREAYHAADIEPFTMEQFQAVASGVAPERMPELRFTAHPSLRLVRSAHPVFSIWADQNGHDVPVRQGGEDVMIIRPRSEVTMRQTPPGGFTFLSAMSAGQTLAAAAASAEAETQGFDLASHLTAALESGVFSGVKAPEG